jgi:tRNA A37 N6-isopentenylltransferase MiaA
MSNEALKEYCMNNNVTLPENHQNRRYVIRAIERKNDTSERLMEPLHNTIIVGIATNRDVLRQRIADRAEQLFENGMVDEAKMLGKKYGWDSEAMTANIYRLVHGFLQGTYTETELKEKFVIADWQLAKRQLTWLKRNPHIVWKSLDEAATYINNELTHRQKN